MADAASGKASPLAQSADKDEKKDNGTGKMQIRDIHSPKGLQA